MFLFRIRTINIEPVIQKLIYRIFLYLTIFTVFEQQAKGQDFPYSLQYITNMQTINPAYVGIWDKSTVLFSTKTNWVGISGAPVTQYANYSTPIIEQKSGVALSIQRVIVGQEKTLFLTGDYSYRLRIDMTHYLQLGLRAGIVNYDNNLKNYQPYPDNIPDPNTVADIAMHNMSVFGIGAVFFSEKTYLSLSVPQIIVNTFNPKQPNFNFSQNFKTMYLCVGHVFGSAGKVLFRPNVLLAGTIGKPVYADVAAIVYLPPVLQLGINIRTNGLVCLSSQYTLTDKIKVGYALGYSVTSDIRKFQLGTHELFLEYDFNIYKRKPTRPHYF